MNKKAVALICCLFLLLLSSAAYAREGTYVAVRGGASLLADSDLAIAGSPFGTNEYKTGYDGAVALGYSYVPGRVEVEVAYNTNDVDGFDENVSALSLMFNAYAEFYDQDIGFMEISTYVGGGLGAAQVTYDISGFGDDDDIVFAWQFALGLGVELSDSVILDLGYRYFATADPVLFSGVLETEYNTSIISLGLRFHL
jgi:opacity protein-like surface antigen